MVSVTSGHPVGFLLWNSRLFYDISWPMFTFLLGSGGPKNSTQTPGHILMVWWVLILDKAELSISSAGEARAAVLRLYGKQVHRRTCLACPLGVASLCPEEICDAFRSPRLACWGCSFLSWQCLLHSCRLCTQIAKTNQIAALGSRSIFLQGAAGSLQTHAASPSPLSTPNLTLP